jgi:adenylosuccinate lyase
MVDVLNPAMTAGTQWFERTLDDSANKRIAMAEGFLAADAILNILLNVSDGLVVYPKVIHSRVMAELPFMASENIMMKAVKKGGDRQELHERLREHAIAAAAVVKQEGKPNDMIARIENDPAFGLTREEIESELKPEDFTGRAPQQVEEFLSEVIKPILDANPQDVGMKSELNV